MNKIKKKQNEIIIYQSKTGQIEFHGDFKKDTIWGSLNQIAELFGRDKSVISRHIKNVFKSKELAENSVVAKIATVQKKVQLFGIRVILNSLSPNFLRKNNEGAVL